MAVKSQDLIGHDITLDVLRCNDLCRHDAWKLIQHKWNQTRRSIHVICETKGSCELIQQKVLQNKIIEADKVEVITGSLVIQRDTNRRSMQRC